MKFKLNERVYPKGMVERIGHIVEANVHPDYTAAYRVRREDGHGFYSATEASLVSVDEKDCPYSAHAYDCACQGMGGDR